MLCDWKEEEIVIGIVPPKMKIVIYSPLKYFQTCMNFSVLPNTKEDILKKVWNLIPATMCRGWQRHALAQVQPRQIFTRTFSKNGPCLSHCIFFILLLFYFILHLYFIDSLG